MLVQRRPALVAILFGLVIFLMSVGNEGPGILFHRSAEMTELSTEPLPSLQAVRKEQVLLRGTVWETDFYMISSPEPGPTVMVIGGIHGDEPAGYLAAENIATWVIDRGTLLVLPRANVPAIAERKRFAPGTADLNRVFPGDPDGAGTDLLAATIWSLIYTHEPDWVIDLHEAEFCERLFPGALGQTIIYPREGEALAVVEEMILRVNNSILNEDYHFLVLRGAAAGSAIESARHYGAESMIVETCRQLPLPQRIAYQRRLVGALLNLHGINLY